MRNKKDHSRKHDGAILGLVAAFGFLLVIVGICFFDLCLLTCGNREFRNAVDAGALTATRLSLFTPTVTCPHDATLNPFWNVLEPDGEQLCLYNAGKVAGFATLVEMNEAAMEAEGTSTGQGINRSATNAAAVTSFACDLIKKLRAGMLDSYKNYSGAFTHVASANSIRMLAVAGTVSAGSNGWQAGYLNNYSEKTGPMSNVAIEDRQIPAGCTTDLERNEVTINGVTRSYILGYTKFSTNAQPLVRPDSACLFVPCRPGLTAHLIDEGIFNSASKPPEGIAAEYCLPNALRTSGRAKISLSNQDLQFNSCGAVDSGDAGYDACIPNGYIVIKNSTQSTTEINPGQFINKPAMSDIKERLLQRKWETDPYYEPRRLAIDLNKRVKPGQKFALYFNWDSAEPPQWLTSQLINLPPDGNSALGAVSPDPNQPNISFQWTPSTGGNSGMLGLLEATVK